jgi:hypothetical protein
VTAIATEYDDLGRVRLVTSLGGEDQDEDGLPDDIVNQLQPGRVRACTHHATMVL